MRSSRGPFVTSSQSLGTEARARTVLENHLTDSWMRRSHTLSHTATTQGDQSRR
ncbi:hypothetical protein BH10ACT9_BH10ACT9_59050 [soil metagenome]